MLVACASFWAASAHSQEKSQKKVPLPAVGSVQPLRVLVVNNPRFAKVDEELAKAILLAATAETRRHFNLDLSFSAVDFASTSEILGKMPGGHRTWALAQSLDLTRNPDMEVLRKSLSGELYRDGGTAKDIRSFSEKFLAEQPGDDSDAALANAIASTQKKYLDRLRTQNTVDGKPPLIDDGFGEYLLWIALGYTRLPYEIVITNQLIASAEKVGNSVHSALRGGISNGLTNSSRLSKTGSFSVVSTYPFVNEDETIKALRNGKTYSVSEWSTYAGALLAHEIGHQLLHLGHPFENPSCLMRPPARLHFDQWYAALNPANCRLNSSAAMTPGRTVDYTDIR